MRTIRLPACFGKMWNMHKTNSSPQIGEDEQKRYDGIQLWESLMRNHRLSSHAVLAEVCKQYGHSVSYWYRWRTRFRKQGMAGLLCRSRRPKRCAKQKHWDPRILNRICVLKAHPDTMTWGAVKLFIQMKREGLPVPSAATVGRMRAHLRKEKRILASAGILKQRNKRKKPLHNHAIRFKTDQHSRIIRIQIDVDHYTEAGARGFRSLLRR